MTSAFIFFRIIRCNHINISQSLRWNRKAGISTTIPSIPQSVRKIRTFIVWWIRTVRTAVAPVITWTPRIRWKRVATVGVEESRAPWSWTVREPGTRAVPRHGRGTVSRGRRRLFVTEGHLEHTRRARKGTTQEQARQLFKTLNECARFMYRAVVARSCQNVVPVKCLYSKFPTVSEREILFFLQHNKCDSTKRTICLKMAQLIIRCYTKYWWLKSSISNTV